MIRLPHLSLLYVLPPGKDSPQLPRPGSGRPADPSSQKEKNHSDPWPRDTLHVSPPKHMSAEVPALTTSGPLGANAYNSQYNSHVLRGSLAFRFTLKKNKQKP